MVEKRRYVICGFAVAGTRRTGTAVKPSTLAGRSLARLPDRTKWAVAWCARQRGVRTVPKVRTAQSARASVECIWRRRGDRPYGSHGRRHPPRGDWRPRHGCGGDDRRSGSARGSERTDRKAVDDARAHASRAWILPAEAFSFGPGRR